MSDSIVQRDIGSGQFTLRDVGPVSITIGPVTIKPDGSIERGAKFTTSDAAAIEFWNAVDRLMPASLRQGCNALNYDIRTGHMGRLSDPLAGTVQVFENEFPRT